MTMSVETPPVLEAVSPPETACVRPVRRIGPRESALENIESAEIAYLIKLIDDDMTDHEANEALVTEQIQNNLNELLSCIATVSAARQYTTRQYWR